MLPSAAGGEPLRIATLAPQGSSFAEVIETAGRRIAERTEGRVQVSFYWSGQLGDERDMLRRMRLGGLDGATLATTGLSIVAPSVLSMQLPLLFRSTDEVDAAFAALAPGFEDEAARAGFIVIAWGDIGWVHLFTRQPPALASLHSWLWADEPYIRDLLGRAGVRGSPLGLGEVAPSLMAGTVDAAYGPLLPALVLGWLSRISYAVEPPLSYSIGALVMTRARWEALAPADRLAIREVGRETALELRRVARRDEARARRAMEKSGVRFVTLSAADQALLERHARAIQDAHPLIERLRATLAR
jgi:TRAP-type C4-dicarboxylate transport system substrate-binding protein